MLSQAEKVDSRCTRRRETRAVRSTSSGSFERRAAVLLSHRGKCAHSGAYEFGKGGRLLGLWAAYSCCRSHGQGTFGYETEGRKTNTDTQREKRERDIHTQMFWPWTTKRKREADNVESAQDHDLQWPELISTALRRTAAGDTSSRDVATAAVNALEPRMRFFQKLSQEERKLDPSIRNERIADAYELMSKTSSLPMRSGVHRGAFEALTRRRRSGASCPTVSSMSYDAEEESKELADFLKRQSPALKKELAKLKLWNKFDVFNVRCPCPFMPCHHFDRTLLYPYACLHALRSVHTGARVALPFVL